MAVLTSNPENSLPAFNATSNTKIGARGEDVTHRIALLHDARHEAASRDPKRQVSIEIPRARWCDTHGHSSRPMETAFP